MDIIIQYMVIALLYVVETLPCITSLGRKRASPDKTRMSSAKAPYPFHRHTFFFRASLGVRVGVRVTVRVRVRVGVMVRVTVTVRVRVTVRGGVLVMVRAG